MQNNKILDTKTNKQNEAKSKTFFFNVPPASETINEKKRDCVKDTAQSAVKVPKILVFQLAFETASQGE
jgi:hypothetical protein